MVQPSLTEKQSQHPPHQILLRMRRFFSKILTIVFLFFSIMALIEASIYLNDALTAYPPEPAGSLNAPLICLLVVASGSLLLLVGWRFPALRLNIWQILLILFGSCLGLIFSFQHIAYLSQCCMFGYQIGHGYPFTSLRLYVVTDNLLSWHQVYDLMRQHPDQIEQDIVWQSVITNGLFYAHVTLIPVVMLRSALHLFV